LNGSSITLYKQLVRDIVTEELKNSGYTKLKSKTER